MKVDLPALKAAASAAVRGPYTITTRPSQGFVEIRHTDTRTPGAPSGCIARVTLRSSWSSAQVATAHMFKMLDPETVLDLVERLERAERDKEQIDAEIKASYDVGYSEGRSSAWRAGARMDEMKEDGL